MDDLDNQLRQLIAEACTHPPESLERQQKLSELYRLVMKSRRLWREYTPYYNDALQEMWEYCCQNLQEYDPTLAGVITWLDNYLKKRLRNLRDAHYRQQKREIHQRQTQEGETTDPMETIPSRSDIQPILEMWEEVLNWVQTDPDKVLRSTYFREYCHVNCQALILRRFPGETPWSTIAAEFRLSESETKDLPKVYHRKCLCLLQKFGVSQGYVEDKNNCKKRISS